ncbi:hypothetical protein L5515_012541 [Caenorhabditis briggsae]|uniref:Yippee domain-containing protein n=1 Tax=Caenorhabditis briggsae TaxID=6238 RepID=A0AAE9EW74_CAEBR|nr:hypothetical protein L5515_012541 [Caenorhabditis briggsae]
MGLKFFDVVASELSYICATCQIYLTNKSEIVSTSFSGITGPAILFKHVKNIRHATLEQRLLMTGSHFVRDIFCANCNDSLGWTYEYASDNKERYKEGCIILERLNILEIDENGKILNMPRLPRRQAPPPDPQFQNVPRGLDGRNPGARNPDYQRNHRLFNVYRHRNQPGLAIPYFRRSDDGDVPQLTIFNEDLVRQAVGGEAQLEGFKHTVRLFNEAVMQCCVERHNRDLLVLGFNHELALRHPNVWEMMEQAEYTPSREADQHLITLFQEMRLERENLDEEPIPIDAILNGLRNWHDQEVEYIRGPRMNDRNPAVQVPMRLIIGNQAALQDVLRERIIDYGFNGALADDDLLFRRRRERRNADYASDSEEEEEEEDPEDVDEDEEDEEDEEEEGVELLEAPDDEYRRAEEFILEQVQLAEGEEEEDDDDDDGEPFDINHIVDPGID